MLTTIHFLRGSDNRNTVAPGASQCGAPPANCIYIGCAGMQIGFFRLVVGDVNEEEEG